MDPGALRSFLELSKHLNYMGAAQALGVTPSVLSDTVAELEKRVGVLLLVANSGPRMVQLTRAGETLKSLAPEFLAAQAELTRQVRAVGDPLLRIAVSDGVSLFDVRTRLHRRALSSDRWAFTLQRELLAKQRSGLQRDELDVGLSQTARSSEDDGLVVEVAWREPLVVLLPRDHPLWGREAIAPSMLAAYSLIVVSTKRGEGYGGQIADLLPDYGVEVSSDSLSKFATIGDVIVAVMGGKGVGLIGGMQWSHSGPVLHTAGRPVVDEKTGEPLLLTTYLRRPVVGKPILAEPIMQLTVRLEHDAMNSVTTE